MTTDELTCRIKYGGHYVWSYFVPDIKEAIRTVRKQLNLSDSVEIQFADAEGAIIEDELLIQYLKIHDKGVILQVLTTLVDDVEVDLPPSLESNISVEDVDKVCIPLEHTMILGHYGRSNCTISKNGNAMDNENSQYHTDLDDSIVANEKRIFSSTRIEDPSNQSIIIIEKKIPTIEVEDTTTSFVVENSGVIHIKTEKILKTLTPAPTNGMEPGDGKNKNSVEKKAPVDNGDAPKDVKKEDTVLPKSDSTLADVYLELDVTDNLDTYLERERIRKLEMSKCANETGKFGEILKNADSCEKSLDECKSDVSLNETVIPGKKSSLKRSSKDSTKKNDSLNTKDNSKEHIKENNEEHSKVSSKENTKENSKQNNGNSTEEINDDASSKNRSTGLELACNSKSNISQVIKTEQNDTEKRDSSRILWVFNVDKTTKATDLKMHLIAFGKVQLSKIVTNGKECFGYVIMESSEDVANCIKNLQNSTFQGKQIVLSDKAPERKRHDKSNETLKLKESTKSEKKAKEPASFEKKDTKTRLGYRQSPTSDPLTLRVSDSKHTYSEERRKVEALERKRFLRERISAERRDLEKKRREMEKQREREKERERQRERERELQRRENERQKQIEMKLEKERKKLEYERKMIEKEKMELLRFKRKLLSKEKENDSHDDHKRRRSVDKFDRKKYNKVEEVNTKHSSIILKPYWKNDGIKASPHDLYKKSNQEICVPPPPPVLSNNYHSVSERPRSLDREKQWYERKEYDNRPKSFARKIEDNRSYTTSTEGRQSYPERPFPKEQYRHKEYNMMQQHNSWSGYSDAPFKEQNIPVLRSEVPRTVHSVRHQTYQEGAYGTPSQEFYTSSGYRRVNDYYNRPTERKY